MEKLDLTSLKSYSPEWPHDLRLAVCIATKYAAQRLCDRARAVDLTPKPTVGAGINVNVNISADTSSSAVSDDVKKVDESIEEEGVELNEEGKPSVRKEEGGASPSALWAEEKKRKKELVESWEEFASKFLTATCQHLGIAEETLPPGPLLFDEILEIGQGRPIQDTNPTSLEAEQHALRLEVNGKETGGGFALTYSDLVLRSDVEEERTCKTPRQKIEQSQNEELAKDEGASEEDRAVEEAADVLAASSLKDEKEEEIGRESPRPFRIQRSGGALSSEGRSDREIEVFNDLLLISLGLGQYRSLEDGATMVFENEALFGEEPISRTAELKTSGSTPDPSPAGMQAELAYQQQQHSGLPSSTPPATSSSAPANPWKSFSKWADSSIKSVGSLLPTPAQPSNSGTEVKSSTTSSGKKARQQPSEFCHYDARARAMIFVATHALGLSSIDGHSAEKILAQAIYFIMKDARSAAANQGKDPLKYETGSMEQTDYADGRTSWMNKAGTTAVEEHGRSTWKRWAAAGGGAAIGAGIIGLTGGLAAPIVLPALASLSGVALFASSGGIVLAAALFGIGGGGLAGYRVSRRLRGLESFEFKEVDTPARLAGMSIPSLHATICISGIILEEAQQVDSWQGVWASSNSRDVYVVSSEAKLMSEAGVSLRGYVFSYLKKALGQKAAEEAIKRTALAAFTALTLPLTVANTLGTALDSTFVRAKSKAVKQGLVLAEVLRAEVQGHRPVVLIGASLGCISILTALNELAKDPEANSHLVDSVYLVCSPATTGRKTLTRARSIVGRRFVNAFSSKDSVCSVAAWLGMDLSAEEIADGRVPRVMGSGPTWGIPGVENIDVSDVVPSHFDLAESDKLRVVCERIGVKDG